MITEQIYPVAVVGGGSAGVMATLRFVLNNDQCLFFPGTPRDKKRSRALWVSKVENMPAHFHFKKGIEDPNRETLEWIRTSRFAHNLIEHKHLGITHIEKRQDGIFILTDSKGNKHFSKYVVLCTGVMDVQPKIGGAISPILPYANVQLADYCLRCDGHHTLDKKTGVIGHGEGAAWVAIMLYERYRQPVISIFLNGEKAQWNDDVQQLLVRYGITIYQDKIQSIEGEPNKKLVLEALILANGAKVSVDIVFISLGMMVYNQLALQVNAEVDARGFVKTNEEGLSSVDGLYVAGDLRANTKKQIYTAWDTAVNAADAINQRLRAERRQVTY